MQNYLMKFRWACAISIALQQCVDHEVQIKIALTIYKVD